MKLVKLLLSVVLLFVFFSCKEKKLVDYTDMHIIDNLWYYKSELEPFTGTSYFTFLTDSSVVDYKNGKWDGRFIIYYSNGNIDTERNYRQDILHGKFYRGTKEGNPLVKGQYRNGKMYGTWYYYDPNGKLKERISY